MKAATRFAVYSSNLESSRLISEQMAQVHYIARRIHHRLPRTVALEDLVQSGILGLIDAMRKFDASKRVHLRSYAKFRIRGAILDSLRDLDWGPRDLRKKARQMDHVEGQLRARHGRAPTEPELAAGMGLSLPEFHRLVGDLRGLDVGSLHTQTDSDENGAAETPVCDPNPNPFELYVQEECCGKLALAMAELSPRERQILGLYYHDEKTMKEIGALLRVGESRVSQIHSAAMARLRVRMRQLLAVEKVPLAS